jgi:predicted dehydrogenase
MVGYLRRFHVTFNKARELLLSGTIGKPESFNAYAYSSDFLGAEKKNSASDSRGGVLRDLGCHAIDLALWFFGDLRVGSKSAGFSNGNVDAVNFKVEGAGVEGEFDVSWCKEDYRMPEVALSISGSKGKLQVSDDEVTLEPTGRQVSRWYRHDLNDNVPFWLGLPEYYREDIHFRKSVTGGSEPEPDFSSAAKVDKIIDDVVGGESGQHQ